MKKKKKYLHKLAIMTLATSMVAFLGISTTTYKKANATATAININITQTSAQEYYSQDNLTHLIEFNNTSTATANMTLLSKRFEREYNPLDDRNIELSKNIANSKCGNIEIYRFRPNANLTTLQYHRDVQLQVAPSLENQEQYTYQFNYITHIYRLPYGNSELNYLFNVDYLNNTIYDVELELSQNVRLELKKENTQLNIGTSGGVDEYGYIETTEIYDFVANQNYNSYLVIFNYITYSGDDPNETNYFWPNEYEDNSYAIWRLTNKKIKAYKITNENVSVDVINIPDIMFQILTMPFTFISMAFNLTLFAGTQYQINISSLFLGILAVIIFVLIIRMLIKMGK